MHPENPCGAMAASAVAGAFQSLLSGSQLGAAKIAAIKLTTIQLVAASEVQSNPKHQRLTFIAAERESRPTILATHH
jgi:hypothetical protein